MQSELTKLALMIFGAGSDLGAAQMAARSVLIFFVTMLLIRIAGRRAFGQKSGFDSVIAILLGATMSRVIVGASASGPTLAAGLCLALLHRLSAWLSIRSRNIEQLFSGGVRVLVRDGVIDHRELRRALLTERELFEILRLKQGSEDLSHIALGLLERSGEISLLREHKAGASDA